MNNGLNIVIIGSSRGIGREVARQLWRQGHNLFCISRNSEALDILKEECYGINQNSVTTLAFDIADIAESSGNSIDLTAKIGEVFSKIDVLFYNAGSLIKKDFSEFTNREAMDIFRVNFFSAAAVIRLLMPLMGGEKTTHIVNSGSMGGFQGSVKFPGLSFYSASKAALAALTESLAVELNDRNIRVNCLALGSAQTEMLEEAFPGYRAPLSAAEMAEFISHFMVTGHKFFNGKVLPVAVSTP